MCADEVKRGSCGASLDRAGWQQARSSFSPPRLALASLLLTTLKAFLKALQYSAMVSSFDSHTSKA